MKKRKKGGKNNAHDGYQQMSLFDLLANDDAKTTSEFIAGEEQSTIYDMEVERQPSSEIGVLDGRNQSSLQSDNERISTGESDRQTSSPGIYNSDTTEIQTGTGINNGLVDETPFVTESVFSRVSLEVDEETRLSTTEKIKRNVAAIELLSKLRFENRKATQEECKVLSQFSGWGGCPQIFNENEPKYQEERSKLRELLSLEQYSQAKESTLTSFYTPLTIIQSMYDILKRIGFEKGTILETSMGTGNFFGMMPKEMYEESELFGIELDSISSEIASHLYRGATVLNSGFETCPYPNNLFDLAISNVPFGNYQLHDKEFNQYHFNIHNYFFAKALKKVRNGGLIAFITSNETMDGNNGLMEYINNKADFLGAIRLPSNVFMMNGANTQATADILFLKRNDEKEEISCDILNRKHGTGHRLVNEYFLNHPEMVFGVMKERSNQYGGYELYVEQDEKTLSEHFEEILPVFTEVYKEKEIEIENDIYIPITVEYSKYPVDAFFVENDILYYRDGDIYYKIKTEEECKGIDNLRDDHISFKNHTNIEKVKQLIKLVDQAIKVIELQSQDVEEQVYLDNRNELNRIYDRFYNRYGALHMRNNFSLISSDPRAYILDSLENYDAKTKKVTKAELFYERTIRIHKEIKEVDNVYDGLRLSLDNKGGIDLSYISLLYRKSEEEVQEELLQNGYVYIDPQTEELIIADEYLSGNIVKKIKIAEMYGYKDNLKALRQVLPDMIKAEDIKIQLGSTWVPEKYIKQFVGEVFEHSEFADQHTKIIYDQIMGCYILDTVYPSAVVSNVWGVAKSDGLANYKRQPEYNGYHLLDDVLNSKIPTIYNYWEEEVENKVKLHRELNVERTMQARDLEEKLNLLWEEWIFQDYDRKHELERIYNEMFNCIRLRTYDGSFLSFPEMNRSIALEPYQKNAVARIISGNNSLLWQQVGAGKTFEMIAAGMEMKRLGIRNKILYVVPNHLLGQWQNEFLQLYPKAKLLVATKKDFAKDKRQVFVNKIATGNYDAIIIAHSSFRFLSVSKELMLAHMQNEFLTVQKAIEEIENSKSYSTKHVKMLERTKKSIKKNIQNTTDTYRDNNLISFDKLGIDFMFVDESHEFKNLYTYTAMNNVAGLQTQHSQKASDMLLKVKIIEEQGGNVCFATGTPITNTMAELYTVQRYLQEEVLHDMGIYCFDAWAKAFGKVTTSYEISIDGSRFVNRNRFCKFFNIQELMTQVRQVAEIQTAGMLKKELENSTLGRTSAVPPKHIGGKPQIIVIEPTEELEEYMGEIVNRSEEIHDKRVDPHIDNMLKVTSDSKKASIDMRLIDSSYSDDPKSKLNEVARKIIEIYHEYDADKGTQLVFCDTSTPSNKTIPMKLENGAYIEDKEAFSNVYDDIWKKLIKAGIPKQEIAFIHDYNNEAAKVELCKKMNDGIVRVLFGSTAKLGAGTNVQKRLIAIHHVDVPYRASDIEQRNGRGFRQGNMFSEIYEMRYVTRKSFDAYSWQMVETKSTYTTQLLEGSSTMREIEEDFQSSLGYAEVKAIASDNPIIKEKLEVDSEIKRIEGLKKQYLKRKYEAQDSIVRIPPRIKEKDKQINILEEECAYFKDKPYIKKGNDEYFRFETTTGIAFTDPKEAGKYLYQQVKDGKIGKYLSQQANDRYRKDVAMGEFLGQTLYLGRNDENEIIIKLSTPFRILEISPISSMYVLNFNHIINVLEDLPNKCYEEKFIKSRLEKDLQTAKDIVKKEFEYESKYQELRKRQKEINQELEIDKATEILDEKENDELEEELDEIRK